MESKNAREYHENLPVGYYRKGIKINPFQRFWHQRRFREICRMAEKVRGPVLDIGCADGTFTRLIAEKTASPKVVGIDILSNQIDDDKKYFRSSQRLRFLVADAHKLPFPSKSFAAVFCLEAMEHFLSPRQVFREIKRVLKPGGYLIALVPTDNFLFKICWWVVLHTWGKHWQNTHIQSFHGKNGLAEQIKKAGLTVVENKYFLLGMLNAVKAIKK